MHWQVAAESERSRDHLYASRRMETSVLLLYLCTGLFFVVLLRTAWQADDAYAAWRLVDNFIQGHGLRYNVDERVQTFTSMLWTFLIAGVYAITGNIYYSSVCTSLALSILAVGLVAWPYRYSIGPVIFTYAAFTLSVSFTDFSAAGFENPLSHLILASAAYIFFGTSLDARRNYFALFLLAGLAGLTRLDTPAYYVGPLAYAAWTSNVSGRDKVIGVALFFGPLLAWHSFSLFYFGFPLQNAAYAKRFNNLPLIEYLKAGLDYYLNSINRDPLTLTVIATALALGTGSTVDPKLRVFAAGIAFYLVYIFFIGGDYMSGRFFSLALLASVIVVLRSSALSEAVPAAAAIAAVVLIASFSPHAPYLNDRAFGQQRGNSPTSEWEQRGIADERASWYQNSGLLLSSRFRDMPISTPEWNFREAAAQFAQQVGEPCVGVVLPTGYFGFVAPRNCHIYDTNGQVDPLMARIPIDYRRNWRQGHLFKPDVAGYEETLVTGENRIVDPDLAIYYDRLRLITRGKLFSWERVKAILAMNIGAYDQHLFAYSQRQRQNQNEHP